MYQDPMEQEQQRMQQEGEFQRDMGGADEAGQEHQDMRHDDMHMQDDMQMQDDRYNE
jgi:hypothetical protein